MGFCDPLNSNAMVCLRHMNLTGGNVSIGTYLKSSMPWKNVLRKQQVAVLNCEKITTETVTISPWSIRQLEISSGCSNDEILELISVQDQVKITEKVLDDETFNVLETFGAIDLNIPVQPVSGFMEDMDMHHLIRLLVWLNTTMICNRTGEMPSLSDSILTVKNELMVPDDFMPGYMMKLVESGVTEMTSEMLNNIQGKDRLLYVICGFDRHNKAYPASIIPSAAFSCINETELYERCLNKVKELFSNISMTEEFQNLTVSRTLRALIYQIEKNNRKDLSGFLWKGEKMTILKSLGLVDETEGKPVVKSDMDLQDLMSMYKGYKSEAEKLSTNWLQTKVSF